MKIIKITLFLLIAIISSCSEEKNSTTSKNEQKINLTPKNKVEDFFSQFEEIRFDSLRVYPDSLGNAPNYKFRGRQIEKKNYYLFKDINKLQHGVIDSVLSCSYKFTISHNQIGLICLSSGIDYSFTCINLYIWDKTKNKITNRFTLADNIGDAGGGYEINSTIYRRGKNLFEITKHETSYQSNERENDDDDFTFNYKYSTTFWVITDSMIKKKE